MSKRSKFPEGWDEARVKRVLEHYESQTEEQAVAEDEAVAEQKNQTLMEVPSDLVPAVRDLIAKNRKAS
jgi:type II secretory pathway component PulC